MSECACSSCRESSALNSLELFYRRPERVVRLTNATPSKVSLTFANYGSSDDADKLYYEILNTDWKNDEASPIALRAAKSGEDLIIARNPDGKLLGLADVKFYNTNVYLDNIATTGERAGTGTEIMQNVAGMAAREGKTIITQSLPSAETFYQGLGFTSLTTHPEANMVLNVDGVKLLAETPINTLKKAVVDSATSKLSSEAAAFKAEYQQDLVDVATKSYIQGEVEGSNVLQSVTGKDKYAIDWTLVQKSAVEYATNYRSLLVNEGKTLINGKKVEWSAGTLDEDVRANIADLIKQAIIEGRPVGRIQEGDTGYYPKGSLAADLNDYFTSMKSHASMVARTETMRHRNAGHVNSYYDRGIEQVIGRSFDCCDLCAEEIEDQVFNLGEEPDLPLHPNCKCIWEPVIPGYDVADEVTSPEDFEDGEEISEENAILLHGGAGSGNFMHEGRLGERGGSVGNGGRAGATYQKGANGEKGTWVTADGSPAPDYVAKLAKPGWTNVEYSEDPDADELVRGQDTKGRTIRMYNERFNQMKQDQKFEKVKELDKKFDQIRAENADNMANPLNAEKAECLSVVMATGVRPGSTMDTKAEKQAYGVTTLEGRHVSLGKDGSVTLNFVGKEGKDLSIPVTDKDAARILSTRAASAGENGQLFPETSASSLRDYSKTLGKGDFRTKDFRTVLGTRIAKAEIAKYPKPTSKREYQKLVKAVSTRVSAQLGNTPTIAAKYYIAPEVFEGMKP